MCGSGAYSHNRTMRVSKDIIMHIIHKRYFWVLTAAVAAATTLLSTHHPSFSSHHAIAMPCSCLTVVRDSARERPSKGARGVETP